MLEAHLAAKGQRMIADDGAHRVAYLESILSKDRGSCFSPLGAEADTIERQTLHFDSRNAKVSFRGCFDLIARKAREAGAQFVYESPRERLNVRYSDGGVC